jgi:hypothetical protein
MTSRKYKNRPARFIKSPDGFYYRRASPQKSLARSEIVLKFF